MKNSRRKYWPLNSNHRKIITAIKHLFFLIFRWYNGSQWSFFDLKKKFLVYSEIFRLSTQSVIKLHFNLKLLQLSLLSYQKSILPFSIISNGSQHLSTVLSHYQQDFKTTLSDICLALWISHSVLCIMQRILNINSTRQSDLSLILFSNLKFTLWRKLQTENRRTQNHKTLFSYMNIMWELCTPL